MKILIMACTFLTCVGHAKTPTWATNNSTKLNGSSLRTVCHGVGPSVDIARSEALKSCQLSASQFFKSNVKIKSLSVETEKSVGFHQEISSNDEFNNLLCDPQKDELEEMDSLYSIWMECKFDLSKTTVTHTNKLDSIPDNKNLNELEQTKIKNTNDQQPKYIFITTVPKCESAIVKGLASRVIQCTQNPLKVQIKNDDQEILIRANGYKPKTIKVKGIKENEILQVLLDIL